MACWPRACCSRCGKRAAQQAKAGLLGADDQQTCRKPSWLLRLAFKISWLMRPGLRRVLNQPISLACAMTSSSAAP
ncbi:hypothetical protein ACO7_490148 [Thiomonas arsenitoxydans]|nr:hypothetical protein ACO7_490148 [Thiomonas arsenitoxydans]CQR36721.1 hypothetical protein ACO3_490148 [Thiomonas arsenitoxydans]CQR37140.1 hypothetical protein THICB6_40023 [Thiomonas arsenitoxydans]